MTTTTHTESTLWRGYANEGGTIWADEKGRFNGAIPIEQVRDNLFNWTALEGSVHVNVLGDEGVTTYPADRNKGIVRSDTGDVLGVHGTGYTVHQYRDWLLTTVGNILDDDLTIAGAGLFKRGAVAFVQVEMPETVSVHGVKYRPYLTAATSHDGSLATTFTAGVTLIVCSNMMGSVTRGGHKVRHTINSRARISDVREALGILHEESDAFTAEIDRLTAITVSDAQWQEFVESYSGLDRKNLSGRSLTMAERKAGDLNGLWFHDPMVKPFAGTAFGAIQAVSTARHHLQSVRGATRGERNMFAAVTGAHATEDARVLGLLERVLA